MPRIKKTYLVSVSAIVEVSAGYEVEAYTLDDALSGAERLFRSEFGISLDQCHDAGFRFEDIDTTGSEVE